MFKKKSKTRGMLKSTYLGVGVGRKYKKKCGSKTVWGLKVRIKKVDIRAYQDKEYTDRANFKRYVRV